MRVVIWNGNADDAAACDDLLWTFDDRAFVPHQFSRDAESMDPATPVHLVLSLEAIASVDMLVNLADRLPCEFTRFSRIAEIIDADPERRRLGRERFKAYRDQKLALQTHQLGETVDI
jgi:DNA polymerase-3 subunit chi